MFFKNTTHLDSDRLRSMCVRAVDEWCHEGLFVSVRYSRGAEFSGSCYYGADQIFINLGRHNRYPYRLDTYIARPSSNRTHWWRELYSLRIPGGEELALFVFLHEFYHRLVYRARRNPRQKEARCDRFATRTLVDDYGLVVHDSMGRPAQRRLWDFQDLDGFVAGARRRPRSTPPHRPAARSSQPSGRAFGMEQPPLFRDV